MQNLDAFALAALGDLEARSLRRRLVPTERAGGPRVVRQGETLISFSCNDYFGLVQHPALEAAAIDAIRRFGTGAGASRLVTGHNPLAAALEERLAAHHGKPAARLFGSGYLANISIVPALTGPEDLILLDALSHACMLGGAKLSGARVLRFRHNDVGHLEELLAAQRPAARRCLVMTERVFSMDGDLAPLERMAPLAEAHDAWLLVDAAHDLGLGPRRAAPLEMGTLSKGLGSYGGYLAASEPVADLMGSRARGLVYSTGLPPACLAAALEALDLLEKEAWRRTRPLELARRFTAAVGLPSAQSAVVPLIVGEADRALDLSLALQRAGFLVVAIRPPTVPPGAARLRFSFSAGHEEAEVDRLAARVNELRVLA